MEEYLSSCKLIKTILENIIKNLKNLNYNNFPKLLSKIIEEIEQNNFLFATKILSKIQEITEKQKLIDKVI